MDEKSLNKFYHFIDKLACSIAILKSKGLEISRTSWYLDTTGSFYQLQPNALFAHPLSFLLVGKPVVMQDHKLAVSSALGIAYSSVEHFCNGLTYGRDIGSYFVDMDEQMYHTIGIMMYYTIHKMGLPHDVKNPDVAQYFIKAFKKIL